MTVKPAARRADDPATLYNAVAAQYARYRVRTAAEVRCLHRFLGLLPNARPVLDAGCGTGRLTGYLVERGYEVTGIDISPRMIAYARRLVPGASFHVQDMCRLNSGPLNGKRLRVSPRHGGIPSASFGGILAAHAVGHLTEPRLRRLLADFARLVVPDGVLCLMVKQGRGVRHLSSAHASGATCRLRLWTVTRIRELLTSGGWRVHRHDLVRQRPQRDAARGTPRIGHTPPPANLYVLAVRRAITTR